MEEKFNRYPPREINRREKTLRERGKELAHFTYEVGKKITLAAALLGITGGTLKEFQPRHHQKDVTKEKIDDAVADTLVNYLDSTLEPEVTPDTPRVRINAPVERTTSKELIESEIHFLTQEAIKAAGLAIGKNVVEEKTTIVDDGENFSLVKEDHGDVIYYNIKELPFSFSQMNGTATQEKQHADGSVQKIELSYNQESLGTVSINPDGSYLYQPLFSGNALLLENAQELSEAIKEMQDNAHLVYPFFEGELAPLAEIDENDKELFAETLGHTKFLKDI